MLTFIREGLYSIEETNTLRDWKGRGTEEREITG